MKFTEKTITYGFGENFIEKSAQFLCDNFLKDARDLSHIACVFGGKRPGMFLRRKLSEIIKKSYIPPRIFSMDEFIDYVVSGNEPLARMSDLDANYIIYSLAKKHMQKILKTRQSFSEFLPWAKEIISFIEQIDLENIEERSILAVEKSADIGYEVPASINELLRSVTKLRQLYHKALKEKGASSRGMRYLAASLAVERLEFPEFDKILFCNFFYLHKTEGKIIKNICDKGKGITIFQGSSKEWSVLKNNSERLAVPIDAEIKDSTANISLYQGFDTHSQCCLVRNILDKQVKNKKDCLIVVPRPGLIIPLLSESSSSLDEFNVSMGYPFQLSSIYVLFDLISRAQESKNEDKYYTNDYLGLLRHPLVKNLKIGSESAITRVMVHKLEELLQGSEETSIGGSLFLGLGEIEAEDKIYLRSSQTLENMQIKASPDECRDILLQLHELLFKGWEKIENFADLAKVLEKFLDVFIQKGSILNFPFNSKIIGKLYAIIEEFKGLHFSKDKLSSSEVWEIFKQKLQSEKVAFVGSPLRGTQILGLFESRSLNFENVIVMDLNEAVLPKLKIHEPLIPREVMLSLGLNRLEKEEEIQRYQFMRLIAAAKEVYLVYEENQINEKSRFIEELLWRKQKQSKKMQVLDTQRAAFQIKAESKSISIKKTPQILEFLKESTYSASRLNTYLNCPLQFYYQYVLGLKEKEDILTDPQARHIGTFIHELLHETFSVFISKRPVINSGFQKLFFKRMEKKFSETLARRMRSDSFLLKRIIENRLKKFLDNEAKRKVEKIISLEEQRFDTIEIEGKNLNFKYTIDRIDELEGGDILVIDYKTGGTNIAPKKFSALEETDFTRESIKENIKSFQLPLYYHFTSNIFFQKNIKAQLYNIRSLELKDFIREADYARKDKIVKICLEALKAIVCELFDPGKDFHPDKEERKCSFCPFISLCS